MEIVQDILKKFSSELNFHSDAKFDGRVFYFELVDTYLHNDFIDLRKIMPYSIKKIFDDINSGKTDLFVNDDKKNQYNDKTYIERKSVTRSDINHKPSRKKRVSIMEGGNIHLNINGNKSQISDLFSSVIYFYIHK